MWRVVTLFCLYKRTYIHLNKEDYSFYHFSQSLMLFLVCRCTILYLKTVSDTRVNVWGSELHLLQLSEEQCMFQHKRVSFKGLFFLKKKSKLKKTLLMIPLATYMNNFIFIPSILEINKRIYIISRESF